jgi:hypothetical protein
MNYLANQKAFQGQTEGHGTSDHQIKTFHILSLSKQKSAKEHNTLEAELPKRSQF